MENEEQEKREQYNEIAKQKAMGAKVEYLIGDSWYILPEIVGCLADMPIKDCRIRK